MRPPGFLEPDPVSCNHATARKLEPQASAQAALRPISTASGQEQLKKSLATDITDSLDQDATWSGYARVWTSRSYAAAAYVSSESSHSEPRTHAKADSLPFSRPNSKSLVVLSRGLMVGVLEVPHGFERIRFSEIGC